MSSSSSGGGHVLVHPAVVLIALLLITVALGIATRIRNKGHEAYQALFPAMLPPDEPCIAPGGVDMASDLVAHPTAPNTCYFRKHAGAGTIDTSTLQGCEAMSDPDTMTSVFHANVNGTTRCVAQLDARKPPSAFRAYNHALMDMRAERSRTLAELKGEIARSGATIAALKGSRDARVAVGTAQTGVRRGAHDKLVTAYNDLDASMMNTMLAETNVVAAVKAVDDKKGARKAADGAYGAVTTALDAKAKELKDTRAVSAAQPGTVAAARTTLDARKAIKDTTATTLSTTEAAARSTAAANAARLNTATSAANQSCTPVDCVTEWSACSASCGPGTKTLVVKQRARNGGKACPALPQTQSCNNGGCAVNCQVSGWGGCSASCGYGTRYRYVTQHAQNGGASCPHLSESCYDRACDRACEMSAWSGCSQSCGGGSQTRYATRHAEGNGTPCWHYATSQSCNTQACYTPPPPPQQQQQYSSAWTPYSSCYGAPGYGYCPSCQSVVDAYRANGWGFNTSSFAQCTYSSAPAVADITGSWGGGIYIYGSWGSIPGRANFSISNNGNNQYTFNFPDDRAYSATAGGGGRASSLSFNNGSTWSR